MTDSEVLQRVIEIAIKNGMPTILAGTLCKWEVAKDPHGSKNIYVVTQIVTQGESVHHPFEFIYNHEFAKSLFGEKPEHYADEYEPTDGGQLHWYHWEYCLAEMVISPDPVDYLRGWLEDQEDIKAADAAMNDGEGVVPLEEVIREMYGDTSN